MGKEETIAPEVKSKVEEYAYKHYKMFKNKRAKTFIYLVGWKHLRERQELKTSDQPAGVTTNGG